MTDLNTSLRNTAQSLINRLGASATLRRVVRTFDAEASRVYEDSVTDYVVKISPPEHKIFRDEQQREVQYFTCMLAAQGLSIEPINGDLVLFDGKTFTTTAVTPIWGGLELVAFMLRMDT